MSGQEPDGPPSESAPAIERPKISIGPGKPNADFRHRIVVSRSGKISDGNYGGQDAFFSLSTGWDDDEEAEAILQAVGDPTWNAELIEALKTRVEGEYLDLEGRIRVRWGLGPTPNRTPAPKVTDFGDPNGSKAKFEQLKREAVEESQPATNSQISQLLTLRKNGGRSRTKIDNFVAAQGVVLVKDLSTKQAADLLILLEAN